MILPKQPLIDIERISHPIKSRLGFEPLERNERTTDFSPETLEDIRSLVTGFVLRAYPEMDEFYGALSHWSGCNVDQLLATDGADGALNRVFATYVSEGDDVVVMSPSYAMYPVYCRMYGARMRTLTFDATLHLSFDDIMTSVIPGTRLLALVNPNQPIESCLMLDQIRQLAARCQVNGTVLLVDEAYYHFCTITAAPLVDEFANVVIARTFSKAFGLAGLRIGYLISSAGMITALRALKPIYEINHLNAAIATYMLRKPQIMESYVESVRRGRAVLTKFFAEFGCNLHGVHSNTILVGLPTRVAAAALAADLREKKWLVRAEVQPPTSNHLRITIGPEAQMTAFCALLRPYLEAGAKGT